jgi:hypothetical protein
MKCYLLCSLLELLLSELCQKLLSAFTNMVTGNQRRELRLTTANSTHQFIMLLSNRPQLCIDVSTSPEKCKLQTPELVYKNMSQGTKQTNIVIYRLGV